jgi:hypothetical protein
MSRDSPTPDLFKDENFEAIAPVLNTLMFSGKEAGNARERRERNHEREREMKWLLMQRGRDMTEDEYNRLVLDAMIPRERSKSRFESCLIPARSRTHPKQMAHHSVIRSLEKDSAEMKEKYPEDMGDKMEKLLEVTSPRCKTKAASQTMAQAWKKPINKYTVSTPLGTQHNKFTRLENNRFTKAETYHPGQKETPKFALHTLRNWFHAIDKEKKGVLSRRQMLNALWHHKDLCEIFSRAAGVEIESRAVSSTTVDVFKSLKEKMQQDFKDQGADDSDIESVHGEADLGHSKAEELRAIARILRDVDNDGSGQVSWNELVEFFRRTGTLLEYETDKGKRQNEATQWWMEKTTVCEEPTTPSNAVSSMTDLIQQKEVANKGQFEVYGALQGRGDEQRRRDSERRSSSWKRKDASTSSQSRRSQSFEEDSGSIPLIVEPSHRTTQLSLQSASGFGKSLTQQVRDAEQEGEIPFSMDFGTGRCLLQNPDEQADKDKCFLVRNPDEQAAESATSSVSLIEGDVQVGEASMVNLTELPVNLIEVDEQDVE